MYKVHYFVERTFKVDDAVGAVAVHGYAGFFGVVVAGFVLWGYPSSPTDGYAAINPLGQFVGALIMFGLLGFLPGWIIAKILNGFGLLRIPRQVELMGLDTAAGPETSRRRSRRSSTPRTTRRARSEPTTTEERTMATVESWGGTITDIGPIYPMVGAEGVLVIIGVAFWIVWHVIQAKRENQDYEEQIRKYGGKDSLKRLIAEEDPKNP